MGTVSDDDLTFSTHLNTVVCLGPRIHRRIREVRGR